MPPTSLQLSPPGPRPRTSHDIVESPVTEDSNQRLGIRPSPASNHSNNNLHGPQTHQFSEGSQAGWWAFNASKAAPRPLSPARLRWWIGICIAFTVLAPVISIVMGITLHAKEMTYPGPGDVALFPGRTLLFEAVLISADPKAGSMRLDWKILGEKNSECTGANLSACTEVNVFFDTNLLRAEGTHSTQEEILTSDRPSRPIFVYNATAAASNDRMANTPTFRTQLALFSPDMQQSSLLFYPFDIYLAEIVFFAQESATNNTVGVEITNTRGIAVGLETQFGHRGSDNVPPGLVEATITFRRSILVKSYCIFATIAVWLITLILVLVMITTVWFGFKQRGEVLLIPVATLFAFTQLRQSMPGAPDGFGDIVDLVGIVPCLAMLALSAAFTLGVFLLNDPTDTPRQIRWGAIYEAFPMLDRKKTKNSILNPPIQTIHSSHPLAQSTRTDS